MNPNEDPTFLCPECARRFIVDLNGGVLQHCPICGNLCLVAEDVDICIGVNE